MTDPTAPIHFGLQYMRGQHRGPNPPQFCGHCARPMLITTEPDWFQPVDRETGQPRYERHARCSRPWWAFGPHDHAVEDENHDWPWL